MKVAKIIHKLLPLNKIKFKITLKFISCLNKNIKVELQFMMDLPCVDVARALGW
jgi:hypothetical protein